MALGLNTAPRRLLLLKAALFLLSAALAKDFEYTPPGIEIIPEKTEEVGPKGLEQSADTIWTKHLELFGVHIFAPEVGWLNEELQAVANVLGEVLDNDEDGCSDDVEVTKVLRARESTIFLPCTRRCLLSE